jgi:hypothetical protein
MARGRSCAVSNPEPPGASFDVARLRAKVVKDAGIAMD